MKQRKLRYFRMKIKQTSRFGRRCREYLAGCVICDGYRFFDEYGRYPITSTDLYNYSVLKEKQSNE